MDLWIPMKFRDSSFPLDPRIPVVRELDYNGDPTWKAITITGTPRWFDRPPLMPAPKQNPWGPPPKEVRPLFEEEERQHAVSQRARKAANRLFKKVFDPRPTHWSQMPKEHLGFRSPDRRTPEEIEEEEERQFLLSLKNSPFFADRAAYAEIKSLDSIKIHGVKAPAIKGNFVFYQRKPGESLRTWRRRVKGMVNAIHVGKALVSEEHNDSLDFCEQLSRASRRLGLDKNPFASLLVDDFEVVHPDLWETDPWKAQWNDIRIRFQKEDTRSPKKPRQGFNYYEEVKLDAKIRLSESHDWRVARANRRERMHRMLIILCKKSHRVVSLRAALERKVEEFAYANRQRFFPQDVVGEMDTEGHSAQGESSSQIQSTSNVEYQTQAGSSVGSSLPSSSPASLFNALASAPSPVSTENFCGREIILDVLTWQSRHQQDHSLAAYDLPSYFLKSDIFKQAPNILPFLRHMYWRGDIEATFECNCNIRQYGQLQISFYYGRDQDVNYDARNNIFSNSQRTHALLTANFSNTVKIKIPFEYIFPILPIHRTKTPVDLGRLVVKIVVPLTVVNSVESSANVYFKLSLSNCEFSGMVGSAIAEAEMFSMLGSAIAIKSMLDNNRDRPSITSPGLSVIPVNSSSWCVGTNQADYTNILRLDPTVTLPYSTGRVPNIDEMSIDYVKKIFGMFKIISWTGQHLTATKLFSMNATPLDIETFYPSILIQSKNTYVFPPVSVLTSLYAYWRGSLNLRIDIVGCVEITGSLLVCYVPRVDSNFSLTLNQAYGCAHAVFDIRENRQIVFNIPYVASQMFWPRRSNLSTEFPVYDAPGAVFVFVVNKLVANSTVPDSTNLIMYLAAGDDFEVAVPACPSHALSFDPKIILPKTIVKRIVIKGGYFPTYSSSWRYAMAEQMPPGFSSWQRMYVPVMRYGGTTDHITQFRLVTDFRCVFGQYVPFCGEIQDIASSSFTLTFYVGSTVVFTKEYTKITWAAIFPSDDHTAKPAPYYYMAPLLSKEQADQIFNLYYRAPDNFAKMWWMSYFKTETSFDFAKVTSNTVTDSNYWKPEEFYIIPEERWIKKTPGAQMDERVNISAPIATPQQTAASLGSASSIVFGETFNDLKDYSRRYQLYASGNIFQEQILDTSSWRTLTIRFPVLPQGLSLDLGTSSEPNEYWNRTRDGPIPIIASGYRFFTGGIRFRICVNARVTGKLKEEKSDAAAKIFVQHRPNIVNSALRVVIQSMSDLGSDDLELPGYAAYHQFDNLNNVISVEIPFYLPSIRSYLQRPALDDLAHRFTSLGELVIGLTVFDYKSLHFSYDIYYSLADDARFSVFVGFPPMFDITSIPAVDPVKMSQAAVAADPILVQVDQAGPTFDFDPDHSNAISEILHSSIYVPTDVFPLSILTLSNLTTQYLKSEPKLKRKMDQLTVDYHKDRITIAAYKIQLVNLVNEYDRLHPKEDLSDNFVNLNVEDVEPSSPLQGEMGLFNLWSNSAEAVEKINKVDVDAINETTQNFKSISETIKDNISSFVPTLEGIGQKFRKYVDVCILAVTNLCHCLLNFNLKSIGIAVISLFAQLKVVSMSAIGSIGDSLTKLFSVFNKVVEKEQGNLIEPSERLPVGEMADGLSDFEEVQNETKGQLISAYVSTLIAGVAALFAFTPKFCRTKTAELGELVMNGISKFAFTANHLFTFVKNNLVAIRQIGDWLFSDHPSVRKMSFLQDKDESVYKWALKVLDLTDPRKENRVFSDIRLSNAVYVVAHQAALLQLKILTLSLTPSQTQVINSLCFKIEKLRERLSKTHIAPPVRFEPFVYELTGEAGIGKSELLKLLPYELLRSMNITVPGEVIYTRQNGNAFWNNLRNQPVCSIDDKFPVKGELFATVQMAELFQLKSSCVFNPPMADIPDKGIRYNPLIVQYASNNPFPVLPEVMDYSALDRRRDALILIEMTPAVHLAHGQPVTLEYGDLTIEERGARGEFEYLRFKFHQCPGNRERPAAWHPWLTYREFLEELTLRFQNFYRAEEVKFREGMARVNDMLPRDGEENTETIKMLFEECWLDKIQPRNVEDGPMQQALLIHDQYRPKTADNREIVTFYEKRQLEFSLFLYKHFLKCDDAAIKRLEQRVKDTKIVGQMAGELPGKIYPLGWVEKVRQSCPHMLLESILSAFKTVFQYQVKSKLFVITLSEEVMHEFFFFYNINCTTEDNFDRLLALILTTYPNCSAFEFTSGDGATFSFGIDFSPCKFEFCPFRLDSLDFHKRCFKKSPVYNRYITLNKIEEDELPTELYNYLFPKRIIEEVKQHEKIEEEVSGLRKYLKNLKESLYQVDWKKWLQRIGMAIAVIAFIGSILGIWNYCSGSSDSLSGSASLAVIGAQAGVTSLRAENSLHNNIRDAFGEAHVSGDYKVGGSKLARSSAAAKVLQNAVGNMGEVQMDALKNKMRKNNFYISMRSIEGYALVGRCLGICGKYAIIVDHYMEAWKKAFRAHGDGKMLFMSCINGRASSVDIQFEELIYNKFKDSSLGLITLPKRIPCFADIRKQIARREDHAFINGNGVVCEVVMNRDDVATFRDTIVKFKPFTNTRVKGNTYWTDFNVHHGYEYEGFSGQGRCGSALLATNLDCPILALHVAGVNEGSYGYSELIYREMFSELGNQPSPAITPVVGQMSQWFVDAEVLGIGKVPSKFAHREKGESRITESELQRANAGFTVNCAPGVLDKKDPRISDAPFSPMLEGVLHHGKPLKTFPEETVSLAVEDLTRLILAKCKPQRQCVGRLSVDEAVAGFPNRQGYEHMEFRTSEGYPFTGMRPGGQRDKRWLFSFDSDNKYTGCDYMLKNYLNSKWQQRNNNIIPFTVFTDCLKDTVIPLDAVLKPGKTRVFSMAPVDFTIQQRQCTLDFSVAYMVCRRDLEHMIGCNPDSIEWTWLANDLLKVSDNIMTGDYSKFGDTIPIEFIFAAYKIIAEWYRYHGCEDQELFNQLEIMPHEVGNAVHLMFDLLYQCVCGMPSGNSLTVIINSIANSLYMRCAWIELMRMTEWCSLKDFRQHVKMFSYGDDLIVALSEQIKHLFNAESISIFFSNYGLKFTNANKSDTMVPYESLKEADFLKRGFVLHPLRHMPQLMLAPLREESIEETVNWVWKDSFDRSAPDSMTFREISLQVCEDSVRNAFGRGPQFYDNWCRRLSDFWLTKNEILQYDTWQQMDSKIFDLGMEIHPYYSKFV